MYGVLLAGGVFVIVNAQTQQDKLAFVLNDSGNRVLLSEPNLSREFCPLAEQMPTLKILRTANAKALPAGIENMDNLLAAHDHQTLSFPKVRRVTNTAAAPLCFMLIAVISKETLCPDYCKKPYC